MAAISQRDAFWERLYDLACEDRDIVVIAADMGAPAMDRIRRDLPGQYLNAGISEQNGLLVAAGLALEGKRPFFYAISNFATLRVIELIRVELSVMDIPVTIVGVGAGYSYEDSGSTHHSLEDVAVMRAFPNLTIHSASDSVLAARFADISCAQEHANYVRLERKTLPDLHKPDVDISKGFAVLRDGPDGYLLSTGIMTHRAWEVADELAAKGKKLGVIDLFTLPPDEKALVSALSGCPCLITLEEHYLPGGIGSYLLELLNTHGVSVPVKRVGLTFAQGYENSYVYGGRDRIHAHAGLDVPGILDQIKNVL